MTRLQQFYQDCVNTPSAILQQYLAEREIHTDVPLGFSTRELLKKHWNEQLLDSKILIRRQEQFVFEDRVVFPIYDEFDSMIAVAGRTIHDIKPKYYNSVYDKSRYLFGLNWSKHRILKHNYVVVTEGYFDFLRLHHHGIPSVALLSTSLTEHQLIKLLRYTNVIIMCLDLDKAGIRATKKLKEKFGDDSTFQLKNIKLQQDEDPDTYILKYGLQKFQHKLDWVLRWCS